MMNKKSKRNIHKYIYKIAREDEEHSGKTRPIIANKN